MAEEPQVTLRGINWREAFPFTHIFRAFRVAIHPSKLVLALLALLSLYIGGRLLDSLWLSEHLAVPGEIEEYEKPTDSETFQKWRKAQREAIAQDYATLIRRTAEDKPEPDWAQYRNNDKAEEAARQGKFTSDVRYWIEWNRDKKIEEEVRKEYSAAVAAPAAANENVTERNQRLAEVRDERIRNVYEEAEEDRFAVVKAVRGRGLFRTFFDYQTARINQVVNGVLSADGGQVLDGVWRFFTVAPTWALQHHFLYFLLFGTLFLLVWSLFGGAIARIAAVHVADEGRKLSVRQGLSFAVSKFLSFLSAPLIPALIILALGVVLAVGGLLLWIPWLGEIVVGAMYFLALAAGFVMTLVLLGTAGGFNLMYPTIAVEGSDSFDAISRSFSYLYAKPWRLLFYSAVALVYGALCYLFIRIFIWLMLWLTSGFVGLLVGRRAANTELLWPTMHPLGSPDRLPYDVNYQALSPVEGFGAFLVSIWVYLAISMLGAFAISFYFSASTIIYFLMRREVDATELDDVYLEQPEEDFTEAPVSPTATTSPAAPSASAPALAAATPESTSAPITPPADPNTPPPPDTDRPG